MNAIKRYLPFAIIAAVLFITVGSGALLFHFWQTGARSRITFGAPGAEPPHERGAPDAPVTLEEFGDFECPPCGNLSPILDKLESDYSGRLRFVFRELPMAMHRHAFRAACAAEAAGRQRRFWEMHDRLYRERFVWPKATDVEKLFEEYAGNLQLDLDRFKKDMDSEAVKRRITADSQRAASLHVDRTPTLFLNDQLVPVTSLNPEGLRNAVDAILKQKPR